MAEVLVAAKSLKVGDVVSDTNFKWQDWPEDSVMQGALVREKNKKITDMAKGRLRREYGRRRVLSLASLTAAGKGNILAAAMEPGMRAMAIKVSAESMVGGFISPGDRVDVLLTYQVRLSGSRRMKLQIV